MQICCKCSIRDRAFITNVEQFTWLPGQGEWIDNVIENMQLIIILFVLQHYCTLAATSLDKLRTMTKLY